MTNRHLPGFYRGYQIEFDEADNKAYIFHQGMRIDDAPTLQAAHGLVDDWQHAV